MFILLLVNKSKRDLWRIGNCAGTNHGYHDKDDRSISDIVEMMEMENIAIQDYVKTRWIDLYP